MKHAPSQKLGPIFAVGIGVASLNFALQRSGSDLIGDFGIFRRRSNVEAKFSEAMGNRKWKIKNRESTKGRFERHLLIPKDQGGLMPNPVETVISEAAALVNPKEIAQRYNLSPLAVLLISRFAGPALSMGLRWARRNPMLALGSAALIGAAALARQRKDLHAGRQLAAT